VQARVVRNYQHQAEDIRANSLDSLYDPSSRTNEPDLLGHPLGYPVFLSSIYRVAGHSPLAPQLLQMILDALSAVIIALIAFELFPLAIGVLAGLLAAFAPQFSWNSLMPLPDSLAAVPILLAVLLIVRACQPVGQAFLPVQRRYLPVNPETDRQECLSYRSRLLMILVAGAFIGVSCWFRANALLLAPFMVLLFFIICKRGERLRPALLLVCGVFLIITPLTIRNALVFREFIPVSLGAGQTLIEGIGDYNTDGSLGMPQTDAELIRGEAQAFKRPDYAKSLFTPDGPARDRARLARGFAVIRAHPVWFFGVMVRRATSMLRLERTPLRLAVGSSWAWQVFQTPLRLVQKLFITALFLPLALIGAGLLVHRRQWQRLAILLVVPFYYFCTQSALHTEYRYVLVIHYFLFVLAAVALHTIGRRVVQIGHGFTRVRTEQSSVDACALPFCPALIRVCPR
jgi:4-amino-4-deoxy-L-arabinose transferase-like glycosyltransferase